VSEPTLCCRARGGYCDRCDLLVGLGGLHVIGVDRDDGGALTVTVESAAEVMGCPMCGVLAHAHGRVEVHLVDAPAMGAPVRIVWRKRRWVCPDGHCKVRSFVEQDEAVAARRARLTTRASGARQRQRDPSPTRLRVAHRVGRDPADPCEGGQGPVTVRGRHHPRGR